MFWVVKHIATDFYFPNLNSSNEWYIFSESIRAKENMFDRNSKNPLGPGILGKTTLDYDDSYKYIEKVKAEFTLNKFCDRFLYKKEDFIIEEYEHDPYDKVPLIRKFKLDSWMAPVNVDNSYRVLVNKPKRNRIYCSKCNALVPFNCVYLKIGYAILCGFCVEESLTILLAKFNEYKVNNEKIINDINSERFLEALKK